MLNPNKPSNLFTNCIPVKGAVRSIIYDLQRESYRFVPNDLYDLIETGKIASKNDLLEEYGAENEPIIDEYLNFLYENEFIFQSDISDLFPKIEESQPSPYTIHDAIIDFDSSSNHPLDKIFHELETLMCQHIELRFFDAVDLKFLEEIILTLKDRIFSSIAIILPYEEGLTALDYGKLLNLNFRIMEFTLTSAPANFGKDSDDFRILATSEKINGSSCCGNILKEYFRVSKPMYINSKLSNNCLDKKIAIDSKGNIKNCPSMHKTFGHIEKDTLNSALYKKDLKALWTINKDQIDTCKDCEFRYMCSDCRVFTENNNDHGKPSKCNYDPYTAKWK